MIKSQTIPLLSADGGPPCCFHYSPWIECTLYHKWLNENKKETRLRKFIKMCRLSRKNRPPHWWKVLFTGEWRECCWSEPESISGLQTWRWQVGYCGANSNSQFFLEILTIQWHPDPSHVPVLSKSFSHNGQTGMQFPHNVYKCLSNINDEARNIFCVQHNGIKRVFIYYYYFFSDKSSSNLLYILPCMLPNKVFQ